MVHQDAPHHLRGDGEKVRTVLPRQRSGACKPQVGFVDQRRGLKSVVRSLTAQVTPGDAMQFLIDQGNQAFEGRFVATAPGLKQYGNALGRKGSQCMPPNWVGGIIPPNGAW